MKNKDEYKSIAFGKPGKKDAAGVYELVKESPPLDLNSFYSYLLLCTHYRDTCVVGKAEGRVASFLSAYFPPKKSDTVFIWQIAVDKSLQEKGVASAMVKHLLKRRNLSMIKYVEATVTPENKNSSIFFKRLAEKLGGGFNEKTLFREKDFAGIEHEKEVLFTIGPIKTPKLRELERESSGLKLFKKKESKVRSYSRSFPKVFDHAKGALLYDEGNNRYIDFFAGAGTLNYGHNNPALTNAMINYLRRGGVVHGLDQATTCKREFIEKIYSTILEPRGLDYKLQFTGPTGTNAVETALKLARLVKDSSNIISFTNGFHGMTMGSLAVTGNDFYRDESHVNRDNVAFMPYDGYFGPKVDTTDYIRRFLEDSSSGVDDPAAMIVETVQGEGGVNVASLKWIKKLQRLCQEFEILLIVDDIQ
ncbi:MAG: diaminobutyrate acetyltransferase, partial [Candidatus Altiarchaeales archaeon]|nr:diaminobutyrate acetyltransferase [Candidatus Altiarchaeales archaeon]